MYLFFNLINNVLIRLFLNPIPSMSDVEFSEDRGCRSRFNQPPFRFLFFCCNQVSPEWLSTSATNNLFYMTFQGLNTNGPNH